MPVETEIAMATPARREPTNRAVKLLIVDNDEDVLLALERVLEDEGYATETAVSYKEAARLLSQHSFDVLILDDHLSDKDSIEVLMELRRSEIVPQSVVITYHVYPSQQDQTRLRLLGAGFFVNKQAYRELTQSVHYLLERRPEPIPHAQIGETPIEHLPAG